jgi:hypothetical protein
MKSSYVTLNRYNKTQVFIDKGSIKPKPKIVEKFKCQTNSDCHSDEICNLNDECQYDARDPNNRRNKL